MTVFNPVVDPAADLLLVGIAELAHRGTIGFEAIGNDGRRRAVALERLPHERQRGRLVAGPGDVALKDFALVIDRAPELDHLAVELHVHLVEVPAPMPKPPHVVHPPPSDLPGKERTEPVPPEAHGLMAKVIATLEQQVLDVPERQRKPDIQHHHVTDQLGR